jgi:hypothetical protein
MRNKKKNKIGMTYQEYFKKTYGRDFALPEMWALIVVLRIHSPEQENLLTAGAMINMRLQETGGQMEYQDSRSIVQVTVEAKVKRRPAIAFKER